MQGLVGILLDISERKQAEAQLEQLRDQLKNIIDSMPSSMIGVDAEGEITLWNRRAHAQLGIDEEDALGLNISELFPQLHISADRIKHAIESGKTEYESRVEHHINDEKRYVDITLFPLTDEALKGAVIRVDDTTDKVQFEEMMAQTEKMLSVGGLAAGMAHEINNPLAGILQNIQVLDHRWNRDTPHRRKVFWKS